MRAEHAALPTAYERPTPVAAVLALLERLLAIAVLVLMSEGIEALLVGPQPEEGSADFYSAILSKAMRDWWLAMHIAVLGLAAASLPRVLVAATRTPLTLALAALAVLSSSWSIAPSETLLRSLMLASATVFGLYLAARYSPRELLLLLRDALLLVVALNLAAVAIWPDATMTVIHAGAWRGLLNHKNSLGLVTVLAGLVLATCAFGQVGARWLSLAGLAGALLLLVGSDSAGAVVTAVVLLLVAVAVAWQRAGTRHGGLVLLLIGIVALAAILLAVLLAGDILVLLGRDPTLTGRIGLWSAVWERVLDHPVLGHGYGAIWGTDDGVAVAIRRLVGWPVPDAHSGYLNLTLDLGVLGLGLMALSLASSAVRALTLIDHEDGVVASWMVLLLVLILVYSMFEGKLLSYRGLLWPLYVAATVHMAGARR